MRVSYTTLNVDNLIDINRSWQAQNAQWFEFEPEVSRTLRPSKITSLPNDSVRFFFRSARL